MLGQNAPLYPFGINVHKYVFLVDRDFISPGIEKRIKDEIQKIPVYIAKGDLDKEPACDIVYRAEAKNETYISLFSKCINEMFFGKKPLKLSFSK